jgi:hypothetical protein
LGEPAFRLSKYFHRVLLIRDIEKISDGISGYEKVKRRFGMMVMSGFISKQAWALPKYITVYQHDCSISLPICPQVCFHYQN